MLRACKPWLPVVLWMGFIFAMSTRLGDMAHTTRFIEPLVRWLCPQISPEALDRVHFLIRKAGHLTEYAILAGLALRAVESSGGHRAFHAAGIAWVVAAAYAASDEFHQSFVPGRMASAGDVLLDAAGAAAALATMLAWRKWRSRLID